MFTCSNKFLPYCCILSKTGVIFSYFAISVFVVQSVQVHPAVFLIYFISVAITLQESHALMGQFSLLYNTAGRASVSHNFILIYSEVFCSL